MASGERFYLLELTHRPAVYGDLGSILKIQGLVIGGEGAQAILMLPGESVLDGKCAPAVHGLSLEEWTDFLLRTDNPEILVMPQKAFHRKVRYEISGAVQQKIWVADGLRCVYCHRKIGEVQLTVDHFIPLEMGGVNNTSNYLSACRKCNKAKGSMPAEMWCGQLRPEYGNYQHFADYLANRQLL